MYTFDHVYKILKNGEAVVTFTKMDGAVRIMRCTLNDPLLPEQYRGKGDLITEAGNTMRVFDLDLNEWRSFRVDSVTNISGGVVPRSMSSGVLLND